MGVSAELTAYANRVLVGTGITAGAVPALVAGTDSDPVLAVLRAGWDCAAAPVPTIVSERDNDEGGVK